MKILKAKVFRLPKLFSENLLNNTKGKKKSYLWLNIIGDISYFCRR